MCRTSVFFQEHGQTLRQDLGKMHAEIAKEEMLKVSGARSEHSVRPRLVSLLEHTSDILLSSLQSVKSL